MLRPKDQRIVAALVLVALVGLAAYWLVAGGLQGAWIDLDQAPQRTAKFRVDINHAPWPEIAELPGIGEKLARRIVASREQDGPFTAVADLERINGIGSKTADRLRPYLILAPAGGDGPTRTDQ